MPHSSSAQQRKGFLHEWYDECVRYEAVGGKTNPTFCWNSRPVPFRCCLQLLSLHFAIRPIQPLSFHLPPQLRYSGQFHFFLHQFFPRLARACMRTSAHPGAEACPDQQKRCCTCQLTVQFYSCSMPETDLLNEKPSDSCPHAISDFFKSSASMRRFVSVCISRPLGACSGLLRMQSLTT